MHWTGNAEEALRLAREGADVAPGNWLTMTLLQTLMANDLHEEAYGVISSEIQDGMWAWVFDLMVTAQRGDEDRLQSMLDDYDNSDDQRGFFTIPINSWSGRRERSNQFAAELDAHYFGPMVLWQVTQWCQCGSPFDLEATPNFAAKIRDADITWPPESPLTWPLKDW
jgi:hypothetical protein